MRSLVWIPLVLLAACHAHTTASQGARKESPPEQKQVASARPVRTSPRSMLDAQAMREIQRALSAHHQPVAASGVLDGETEGALRRFQRQHQMAETGLPDYDTLHKLGLDPKRIYLGHNRASR